MTTVDISPWAGDRPRLYISVENFNITLQAASRTFWIYFNVQTVPSKKYEDLSQVATAAAWSFMIHTGEEQLLCTNTVSYDVRKTLDGAVLTYKHKNDANISWELPISRKNAIDLSKALRKTFTQYDKQYLVDHKPKKKLQEIRSVLKTEAEMLKYRFSFNKA